MNKLILNIESKVISTNIKDFEEQANTYLANLTTTFKTDEDFANAESEVKELKKLETATKKAIEDVVNGSADVSKLIETATAIAERFRQERLTREKLVKAEKDKRKQEVIDNAVTKIKETYLLDTPVTPALKMRMPFEQVKSRLADATKNKRTIDSIDKSVNTEFANITAEMMTTVTDLQNRLAQLPADKMHLFADVNSLIASTVDIQEVVKDRVAQEEQRIAIEKECAEAERQAEAERLALQREQEQKNGQVAQPVAEPVKETVKEVVAENATTTQSTVETDNEPLGNYAIIVNGATLSQIKRIAGQLKGQFPSVQLKKI